MKLTLRSIESQVSQSYDAHQRISLVDITYFDISLSEMADTFRKIAQPYNEMVP